ncbi:MAG: ATPase, T2SS/T4P/T4SS family, partial [Thermodesulfovibrionales bacterium]
MERELKVRIREEFISRYGGQISAESKEFERHVQQGLEQLLSRRKEMSEDEKKAAVREILSEFVGLGPIEEFMQDPTVTEIMINGPSNVYIERNGKKLLTDVTFDDEHHLKRVINRMLSATRRHVDESNAYVDVALKDGSRVNIIIPPLALNGPVVTIRKFLKELRTVDDLIEKGTMDRRMAEFLIAAIRAKLNIIFSGASGAGKTTTANVLSSYIEDERIVTIEDTAELILPQEHVVRLEARQPSIE